MKKSTSILLTLTAAVALFGFTQNANAATFNVDISNDEVDGSCVDGDCSLRDAIILANANGEADTLEILQTTNTIDIPVGNATQYPDGEDFGDFDITSEITIRGSGSEVITVDTLNVQERVFEVHSGAHLTIDNVIVSGGMDTNGGLIYNDGTLTLNSATLESGQASIGGALYNTSNGSVFTSEDNSINIFENNQSSGQGGAIYSNGNMTLTDAQFTDNVTVSSGGAIAAVSGATTTINRAVFTRNEANSRGGALYVDNLGSTNITRSRFGSNQATDANTANDGGAINADGSFTMTESSVTNNVATTTQNAFGGGIYVRSQTTGLIENNTFSGNQAIATTTPSASYGGGIAFSGANTVSLVHNTFIANEAGGNGPGIDLGSTAATGQIILKANIITDNLYATGTAGDIDGTITITSGGYNKIGTTSNYDGSPKWSVPGTLAATDEFGVASDFDVDALTEVIDEDGNTAYVHPIRSNDSEGVDAITDQTDCSVITDQLGVERQDGECDAGAYEYLNDGDNDGSYEWEDECDNDSGTTVALEYLIDSDSDGHGTTETVFACPSEQPIGTILATSSLGTDQCDADAGVFVPETFMTDADADGFGAQGSEVSLCPSDAGSRILAANSQGDDQCDQDSGVDAPSEYVLDADGDGYGDSVNTVQLCPADAAGYILASTSQGLDADPTDPTIRTSDDLVITDLLPRDIIDRSTTDLSTLDVTDASVFAAAVSSLEGRQNGIARVTLVDGRVLNHEIFSRGRRTIKVNVLPQSGIGVAIAGGGKYMKLFNPYTGEVYDSVRLSKKKRKARNMKFLNLRRDGKKIVVTLKKKKKAKKTRVVVVAYNTSEQTLRKRGGKNVKGIKAIRVSKTRRGKKRNRIVLKSRRNKTKAVLKVKRTYKLKRVK